MSDDVVSIERAAVRSVPATGSARLEGWWLSFGRGQVRRMNSVTTFGIVPDRMFETVESVERRYRGRNRPVSFRLTHLDAELDDLLFARGYDRESEVVVMAAPVTEGPLDGGVTVHTAATPGWVAEMGALGDYDELRSAEIAESLAALTLDHATFGLPGAVGLAVADGALCGLFDIAVARDRRRAGLGSRITSAAMRWGAARRCSIAYLQVTDGNRAARGLYDKLGFEERYRYWYRTRK